VLARVKPESVHAGEEGRCGAPGAKVLLEGLESPLGQTREPIDGLGAVDDTLEMGIRKNSDCGKPAGVGHTKYSDTLRQAADAAPFRERLHGGGGRRGTLKLVSNLLQFPNDLRPGINGTPRWRVKIRVASTLGVPKPSASQRDHKVLRIQHRCIRIYGAEEDDVCVGTVEDVAVHTANTPEVCDLVRAGLLRLATLQLVLENPQ
jgi:hypothetical protein